MRSSLQPFTWFSEINKTLEVKDFSHFKAAMKKVEKIDLLTKWII